MHIQILLSGFLLFIAYTNVTDFKFDYKQQV